MDLRPFYFHVTKGGRNLITVYENNRTLNLRSTYIYFFKILLI